MNWPRFATLSSGNKILFPEKIAWGDSQDVMKKLHAAIVVYGNKIVTFDFSHVMHAYPNGVVPVIAEAARLSREGVVFEVIPPSDEDMHAIFSKSGWLYHLEPSKFSPPKAEGFRSLPLQKFTSDEELNEIVNRVVEICLQ